MNKNLGTKLLAGLSSLSDKAAVAAGKSLYGLEVTAGKVGDVKNDIINKIPRVKIVVEKK